MVDAYQDITIPFQMSSVEFFTLVREHLNENGVMVVNMNMRSDSSDGINSYLSDTIASVFDQVYTIDVKGSTNRVLFASDNADMLKNLDKNTSALNDKPLSELMDSVSGGLSEYNGGQNILTDDKAPVELLGMKVIDDIIQDELEYYRNEFIENGISGIINR